MSVSVPRERDAQANGARLLPALGRWLGSLGPLLVFILMFVGLWIFAPAFRSPTSVGLLLLEAAAIAIVSAGQTYVIMTGGIDLSVEAMVSFSGVIAAILIAGSNVAGGQVADGIDPVFAIAIALAAGLAIGLFQGSLITWFRMNPLIVTLGSRSILLGFALVLTNGAGINIRREGVLEFITSRFDIVERWNLPMPFIIAMVIFVISWIVLRQTRFGRYTYAIGGGGEEAARLSGINVNRIKIMIYGISGLLAAVAGVIVMARLRSGAYQNGTDLTLMSVAAVVIGGTPLTGGKGGIWGTLAGVFIIRIVNQGMVYLSVPSNAKEIVLGSIIVLAVLLDVLRQGEISWLRFGRRRAAT
ncbi:MAG: ABC transporter permease [Chloroflexi bacterium]|nr:ABC transporter permease [Chloroflexota bacterium]